MANSVSMGKYLPLSGLELLRRKHVLDAHCGLDRTVANLAAHFASGKITAADLAAFKREACESCESFKMRRRSFNISRSKLIPDHPLGKIWAFDVGGSGSGGQLWGDCEDAGYARRTRGMCTAQQGALDAHVTGLFSGGHRAARGVVGTRRARSWARSTGSKIRIRARRAGWGSRLRGHRAMGLAQGPCLRAWARR